MHLIGVSVKDYDSIGIYDACDIFTPHHTKQLLHLIL